MSRFALFGPAVNMALCLAGCLAGTSQAAQPIIDNERVTVWDLAWRQGAATALPAHTHDFVTVYLAAGANGPHKKGDVVYAHAGVSKLEPGERTVVIELKDHPVAPIPNTSGYPPAFPRPHVKKVLENGKVIVWSYAWHPGEPTPMHFHDKDVVVVYMEDTALRSTTPDGKSVVNEYSAFQTKFNRRDRVHSELLARGTGSAIMTELK
ncbi:MAG TPA: hypothetical protein VKV17_08110 [Bryobacteraceae bacterium]|nr:hypothetical protein [Bryobacteraceae bacterium]